MKFSSKLSDPFKIMYVRAIAAQFLPHRGDIASVSCVI